MTIYAQVLWSEHLIPFASRLSRPMQRQTYVIQARTGALTKCAVTLAGVLAQVLRALPAESWQR